MLASVVITNHNYERFLGEAIESALAQTHSSTEVVVVDDGSTDGSRALLERRAGDVQVVLKPRGGQRSAFNAGLARSRGELVCFLDADDTLAPTAIERAAELMGDRSVSKVHWPLRGTDAGGVDTGALYPPVPLPDGWQRDLVLAEGPYACVSPPASGNAWARWFLDRTMPIPETGNHAEAHLVGLAPLYGKVRAVAEPLATYRHHGANDYATAAFVDQLERDLALYDERCDELSRHCTALGLDADSSGWRPRRDWLERLSRSLREIERLVPLGEPFVFVDECQWGLPAMPERPAVAFPARDGTYWGPPADDADAIDELDRVRAEGVRFVAFAWQAFWWLEHYSGFAAHLERHYSCLLANERLRLFVAPE